MYKNRRNLNPITFLPLSIIKRSNEMSAQNNLTASFSQDSDFSNLRPIGTTTYDRAGRRALVILDNETGRETTFSDHIERTQCGNDARSIRTRGFMHSLDGIVSWYTFDDWRPGVMRIVLRVLGFPIVAARVGVLYLSLKFGRG